MRAQGVRGSGLVGALGAVVPDHSQTVCGWSDGGWWVSVAGQRDVNHAVVESGVLSRHFAGVHERANARQRTAGSPRLLHSRFQIGRAVPAVAHRRERAQVTAEPDVVWLPSRREEFCTRNDPATLSDVCVELGPGAHTLIVSPARLRSGA
jgi:hypothetical protein